MSRLQQARGGISGCEWDTESKIFSQAGLGGLIEIILQAAGLAGPVLLLTQLGSFGSNFANRVGSHPILGVVLMIIILLLVGTMLNVFIPFLDLAFLAIDGNRFIMYDTGLGKLSTVVSSFYGVVLVSGMLMLAWQLWQSTRSGNIITGGMAGQRM